MIEIREIIAMTALNFGLDAADILAVDSRKPVVQARHVAMHVARKSLGCSTLILGAAFQRDHTTVIYGLEKIDAELKAAPGSPLAALISSLIKNVEFRQRIEKLGGIDVINVARRIAAAPINRAIGASVMEVAALAATVLDLWEIALAAEDLAAAMERREALRALGLAYLSTDQFTEIDDLDRQSQALGRAITDEMAVLRGPQQQEEA